MGETDANTSQHRELTVEKKIHLPLLPGLDLETVRPGVQHSELNYPDPYESQIMITKKLNRRDSWQKNEAGISWRGGDNEPKTGNKDYGEKGRQAERMRRA